MKLCSKCKIEKELDQFCTDNRTPDNKKRWCRDCCSKSMNKWKEEHPDRYAESLRNYRNKNRHKLKAYDAMKYQANKEKSLSNNKRWRTENAERRKATMAKWFRENKGKMREYRKKYVSSLRNRLHVHISRSILKSLRGGSKGNVTWPLLVGYDVDVLVAHLTKTMPEGYTWQDYGKTHLHIDHIIPVSAFDFSSPDDPDFRKCWGLENLRLLPAVENLRKGAKLDYNVREQRSVLL